MTENITAIPVSNIKIPDGTPINTKPCHLILLTDKVKRQVFIALERPILDASHIQTKGFFVEKPENEVIEDWTTIVKEANMDKSKLGEFYFPWHRVIYIRNLVYKSK